MPKRHYRCQSDLKFQIPLRLNDPHLLTSKFFVLCLIFYLSFQIKSENRKYLQKELAYISLIPGISECSLCSW